MNTINLIQQDMKHNGLITSTKINHYPGGGFTEIFHNYNNNRFHQKKEVVTFTSNDNNFPLIKLLSQTGGLKYTQALFGTKDSPEEICDTLNYLTSTRSEDIKVYTPQFEEIEEIGHMVLISRTKKLFIDLGLGHFNATIRTVTYK